MGLLRRYITFHNMRHPREMGGREIEDFLSFPFLSGRL